MEGKSRNDAENPAFAITGVANLGHAYSCNKCGALVIDENRELHFKTHRNWKATIYA